MSSSFSFLLVSLSLFQLLCFVASVSYNSISSSSSSVFVDSSSCASSSPSYFVFQASLWCDDVVVTVNNQVNISQLAIFASMSSSFNSPSSIHDWAFSSSTLSLSQSSVPGPQSKVWSTTVSSPSSSTSTELRITVRDPEYFVGPVYIAVYTICATPSSQASYQVSAQHAPRIPLPNTVTLVPSVTSLFTITVPNSYYGFEFCVETTCDDLTLTMQAAPGATDSVCPITLVSNRRESPQRKDFAWSQSCGTLTISHADPFYDPGFYYGNVNSWCTPDYICNVPSALSSCYPCANYNATTAFSLFNLTLTVQAYDPQACVNSTLALQQQTPVSVNSDPSIVQLHWTGTPDALTLQSPIRTMNCSNQETHYYSIDVINPCADLTVNLLMPRGQTNLMVSRLPILHPSYQTIIWADWWWFNNSVSISHEDQDFVPGTYTIAVVPYCGVDLTYDPNPSYYIQATLTTSADSQLTARYGQINAGETQYLSVCVPPSLPLSSSYIAIAFTDIGAGRPAVSVSTVLSQPSEATLGVHLDYPIYQPNQVADVRAPFVLWSNTSFSSPPVTGVFYVVVTGRCFPSPSCPKLSAVCVPCSNMPSNFALQLIVTPNGGSSNNNNNKNNNTNSTCTVTPSLIEAITIDTLSPTNSVVMSSSNFVGLIIGVIVAVVFVQLCAVLILRCVQRNDRGKGAGALSAPSDRSAYRPTGGRLDESAQGEPSEQRDAESRASIVEFHRQ